jgi:hypothetical protein
MRNDENLDLGYEILIVHQTKEIWIYNEDIKRKRYPGANPIHQAS